MASTRKVFILRAWQYSSHESDWVVEVQNVSTGEIQHAYGWNALLGLLRQIIPLLPCQENGENE